MLTAVLTAVLTAALLAGCSPDIGTDTAPPGLVLDGPVIAHGAHKESAMAAYVGGTLAHEGQCLRLDGEPVLWPVGTTWDQDTSAVVLPEGGTATAGAALYGGGGHTPFLPAGTDVGTEEREASTLIEQCLGAGGQVTNFNTGAQLTSSPQPP
ncbi:hypothetical protein GCM10027586_17960 [Kineococcus gypseus]